MHLAPHVRAALSVAFAEVGDRFGWPGFWVFLGALVGVAVVVLYLFFRSQPPSGPKMGE